MNLLHKKRIGRIFPTLYETYEINEHIRLQVTRSSIFGVPNHYTVMLFHKGREIVLCGGEKLKDVSNELLRWLGNPYINEHYADYVKKAAEYLSTLPEF